MILQDLLGRRLKKLKNLEGIHQKFRYNRDELVCWIALRLDAYSVIKATSTGLTAD